MDQGANLSKSLPITLHPVVLRTDFIDQTAWEAICRSIRQPISGFPFLDNLDFVDDPAFSGLSKDELLARIAEENTHSFLIVADRTSMSPPDYPLLVVDLFEEPGREIRVVPSVIDQIANNLEISNMDFEDFTRDLAEDGIFRGFL